MRKFLLLPLLIICLWQTPSFANEAEFLKGVEDYEAGNYQQAFKIFKPLAEQGFARAQDSLGSLYYEGKGVPRNYSESIKWYRLSAKQGFAGAQGRLGIGYLLGEGVPKSFIHAYMWLSIAKTNGSEPANEGLKLFEHQLTPSGLEQAQLLAVRCINSGYKDCG